MMKIRLYFTTSKFAAYLILFIGSVFAFVFSDPTVLLGTFSATSAILVMKTYTTMKTDINTNDNQLPQQTKPDSDLG